MGSFGGAYSLRALPPKSNPITERAPRLAPGFHSFWKEAIVCRNYVSPTCIKSYWRRYDITIRTEILTIVCNNVCLLHTGSSETTLYRRSPTELLAASLLFIDCKSNLLWRKELPVGTCTTLYEIFVNFASLNFVYFVTLSFCDKVAKILHFESIKYRFFGQEAFY